MFILKSGRLFWSFKAQIRLWENWNTLEIHLNSFLCTYQPSRLPSQTDLVLHALLLLKGGTSCYLCVYFENYFYWSREDFETSFKIHIAAILKFVLVTKFLRPHENASGHSSVDWIDLASIMSTRFRPQWFDHNGFIRIRLVLDIPIFSFLFVKFSFDEIALTWNTRIEETRVI